MNPTRDPPPAMGAMASGVSGVSTSLYETATPTSTVVIRTRLESAPEHAPPSPLEPKPPSGVVTPVALLVLLVEPLPPLLLVLVPELPLLDEPAVDPDLPEVAVTVVVTVEEVVSVVVVVDTPPSASMVVPV